MDPDVWSGQDAQEAEERDERELLLHRQSVLLEQSVLLDLAAARTPDFAACLRQILRTDAELMDVERVSYWSIEREPRGLRCEVLYRRTPGTFEEGARILESDHPLYYQSLLEDLYISADDAREDPRTREFAQDYLEPLGITSMLDVPVWVRGHLGGVVCHEHVGPRRVWTMEEQALARSIGHVVSMALETSERRKAEESLRQSEERFRLLVDGVKDQALVMLDEDGRVVSWNAGAERITGYGMEEALGKHFADFHPRDSVARGQPQAQLRQAVEAGRLEVEGWRRRKNGSYFWAGVVLTPLRDADGRLRGFAEISRDMTERRMVERQQRLLTEASAAEQRQRLLAEVSAVLVSSLDTETALTAVAQRVVPLLGDACLIHLDEGGTLRLAACDHCPMGSDAPLCKSLGNQEVTQSPRELARVVRSGRSRRIPDTGKLLRRLGPDTARALPLLRALRPASVLIVPMQARGRVLGALTLIRDTPGRAYSREEQLLAEELGRRAAMALDNARLYQESQKAINTRDEFLSIASHELRTPVTTLLLQLQNLRRYGEKLRDSGLERKLDVAMKQTHRLDKLIDGLLDVSRISADQLRFDLEELDLSRLAAEVVEQFQADAARAGCELRLRAEGPVTGWYDRLRIEQVLANLLSNAIKYSPGKPVEVTVEPWGDQARLTVEDRGIGIPAKDLSRIFSRFERAVSPQNYGGLGLGLFITQRIVQAHGGSIQVRSHPGEGSTFTVLLPREAPKHTGSAEAS